MSARLRVVVAYAAPGSEALVPLELDAGATVADAVARSGLVARYALVPAALGYAIFGQTAQPGTPLAEGDRVELTRPLVADPKDRRRQRARGRPPTPTGKREKPGSD